MFGDIQKNNINTEFLPIKTKLFEEKEIDITNLSSKEDLIQLLNEIQLDEDKYLKIILTGEKSFSINKYEIMELVQNEQIIKIKDDTKEKYNIAEIAKEPNLMGLFAKNILAKMKDASEEDSKKLMESFEIGMEVLKNK